MRRHAAYVMNGMYSLNRFDHCIIPIAPFRIAAQTVPPSFRSLANRVWSMTPRATYTMLRCSAYSTNGKEMSWNRQCSR